MQIHHALNNEEARVSFEYMYDTYKNTVRNMIRKKEEDNSLWDDVMQDIFIKFYKSMGRVQGEEAARRWLMTIARNEIVNHYKSETLYKKRILLDFSEEDMAVARHRLAEDAIFETAFKKELGSAVREKIRQLRPKQQEVIVLKYYYDYTAREIAYMLKCPLNTVYSRLKKAELILQNTLYSVLCRYYKKEWSGNEQLRLQG